MQKELQNELQGDFERILTRLSKRPDFIIQLPPITKKNSQEIIYITDKETKKKKPIIIQSEQYREYEKNAGYFLRPSNIDSQINITYLFYMKTKRKVDASNLIAAADDVLVKYGVIQDDNKDIVKSHSGSLVLWDKDFPRTEIYITDLTSFKEKFNGD